jgi:hypothetical protein
VTVRYRADVRVALLALGVHPHDETPPARVREFVNDLYTWELRRLRQSLARGDFPKREYAGRVEALRRQRYWVLSLPIEQWREEPAAPHHI